MFHNQICHIMRLRAQAILIALFCSVLMVSDLAFGENDVKWQPGHYMRFNRDSSVNNMVSFLENPYTKGLLIQIPWKVLEPNENDYDFTEIDRLLDLVKSRKRFLVLSILDRCFHGCSDANAPSYLRTKSVYNGGVQVMYASDGTVKGSVIRLWDSKVTDRFIGLYQEIGRRYDLDSGLVGVTIGQGESAIAIDKQKTPGYSDLAYEKELKRMATAVNNYLPRTVSFTGMNFIAGKEVTLERIAAHMSTLGSSGITHPDTIPSKDGSFYHYEIEANYSDRLAIGPMINTQQIGVDLTEEKIYNFCINRLRSNFIFWNAWFTAKSGEKRNDYIRDYVLPVVSKYRGETVKDCPESFPSCSDGVSQALPDQPETPSSLRIID